MVLSTSKPVDQRRDGQRYSVRLAVLGHCRTISQELPKFKMSNVSACCDSIRYRRLQHSTGDLTSGCRSCNCMTQVARAVSEPNPSMFRLSPRAFFVFRTPQYVTLTTQSSKQSSSNGSCIRACSTAQPAVKVLSRQTAWMQTTYTEHRRVTNTIAAVFK